VVAEGDAERRGHEQHGERLGHHQRVVHPEVRVDGGDGGGEQADPIRRDDSQAGGEAVAGQADDEHRNDAE
jgi:hypothetical protein